MENEEMKLNSNVYEVRKRSPEGISHLAVHWKWILYSVCCVAYSFNDSKKIKSDNFYNFFLPSSPFPLSVFDYSETRLAQ